MESLLIIGFLLGLAILAPRFGHDSHAHPVAVHPLAVPTGRLAP